MSRIISILWSFAFCFFFYCHSSSTVNVHIEPKAYEGISLPEAIFRICEHTFPYLKPIDNSAHCPRNMVLSILHEIHEQGTFPKELAADLLNSLETIQPPIFPQGTDVKPFHALLEIWKLLNDLLIEHSLDFASLCLLFVQEGLCSCGFRMTPKSDPLYGTVFSQCYDSIQSIFQEHTWTARCPECCLLKLRSKMSSCTLKMHSYILGAPKLLFIEIPTNRQFKIEKTLFLNGATFSLNSMFYERKTCVSDKKCSAVLFNTSIDYSDNADIIQSPIEEWPIHNGGNIPSLLIYKEIDFVTSSELDFNEESDATSLSTDFIDESDSVSPPVIDKEPDSTLPAPPLQQDIMNILAFRISSHFPSSAQHRLLFPHVLLWAHLLPHIDQGIHAITKIINSLQSWHKFDEILYDQVEALLKLLKKREDVKIDEMTIFRDLFMLLPHEIQLEAEIATFIKIKRTCTKCRSIQWSDAPPTLFLDGNLSRATQTRSDRELAGKSNSKSVETKIVFKRKKNLGFADNLFSCVKCNRTQEFKSDSLIVSTPKRYLIVDMTPSPKGSVIIPIKLPIAQQNGDLIAVMDCRPGGAVVCFQVENEQWFCVSRYGVSFASVNDVIKGKGERPCLAIYKQ